jgi:hypothetical protein
MANVSRVNGARPTKYLNGSPWNGQANLYFIPSGNGTATFVGDFVKADGTGDPVASGGQALGVPSCIQAAATNAMLGAIVGFIPGAGQVANQSYVNLNSPNYRFGSIGTYCWVVDDPSVLFEIQASNGTPAVGDVMNNVNIAVAAGSTTTGQSGMTADVATILTTAALPLKIMAFSQRADNDNASAAAKYIVKINNHQYSGGTGTLGV